MRNIKIKKKFLDNKSRKGWYYYLKEYKQKPAYYKIHPGVSIDNYFLAYKGKVRIKKKGVVRYTKETPAEKYLRKVEKGQKIEDLISPGISESTLPNLKFAGRKRMHKAYVKMLGPRVLDKELLDIISLEENVRKFKHRIESTITLVSSDGKVQFQLKAFNKTLLDIEDDLKGMSKRGIFESDLKSVMKKGYRLASLPKGFDIKNYEKNFITSEIGNIKVNLKFRKGRRL